MSDLNVAGVVDLLQQMHVSCKGLNVRAHTAMLLHLRGERVWIWVISGKNHLSDRTKNVEKLGEERIMAQGLKK